MDIKNIDKLINNEIIPVIIYNKLPSNYKIQKQNNNIKIAMNEFVENNKQIKNKYHLYLNEFISKLKKHFKHCNFDNFCNNVTTIKFIEKNSKIKGFLTFASYFTRDNKIEIYNDEDSLYLNHELLHMVSNKKINKKLIITGFGMIDFKKRKKYGIFINEGYTEHLNRKYFYPNAIVGNQIPTYRTQVKFVQNIEKIIGEYLMQQMYFNADLKGLINELIKYKNTKEEVLEFIINTDIMHECRFSINPLKRLKLKRAAIKVNAFLVKSYYVKLLNNNLTHKNIVKEMTNFMNDLVDIDIDFKSNYYYMDEVKDYYDKEIKKKKKLT